MENDVLKCIKARRSVRVFNDRPLEQEQIDALLEAAIWAPSGGNRQGWQFTAILNKQTLKNLNEIVLKGLFRIKQTDIFPPKLDIEHYRKKNYSFYNNAPLLIIASNEDNPNSMADCAAALQNVLLAAQSIGLGSCWLNHLKHLNNDPSTKAFLLDVGIPCNHIIYGAVAVGYAAYAAKPPLRKPDTIILVR